MLGLSKMRIDEMSRHASDEEGRLKGSLDNIMTERKLKVKRKGRGFNKEYETMDSAFTRSKDVPMGKWDHSGFEEMYGNKRRDLKDGGLIYAGRRIFGRQALSNKVKLHVTNLAPTVTTADMKDLLCDFIVDSVKVHYDEFGESTGTADVVTDRASAEEIRSNYHGVSLDGLEMHMFIINEVSNSKLAGPRLGNISQRLNDTRRDRLRLRGVSDRPIRKKMLRDRVIPNKIRSKDLTYKRNRMTEAELDRELEEYMKKKPTVLPLDS